MDKLRFAIWGCGGHAGGHARKLAANPDVHVDALCSRFTEEMERLVARRLNTVTPAPTFYTDAAAMFDQERLDGVIILTPHTMHFDAAMLALDKGVHVLLEKPMVTNSADAAALAAKVSASGKRLVVCYNTAFSTACHYVRAAARSGSYGRLEMVTGYLAQDWKRLTKGTWRHDPSLSGGGQTYDSGVHLLNSVCWCVESDPVHATAYFDYQDDTVDINGAMSMRFENGVLASLAIGGNCPSEGSHLSFLFDKGRIDLDGWGGSWMRAWRGADAVADLPEVSLINPTHHFVDVLLGRAAPLCTVEHGVRQAKLLDLLYASAKTTNGSRR